MPTNLENKPHDIQEDRVISYGYPTPDKSTTDYQQEFSYIPPNQPEMTLIEMPIPDLDHELIPIEPRSLPEKPAGSFVIDIPLRD